MIITVIIYHRCRLTYQVLSLIIITSLLDVINIKKLYHGCDGLLAGVIVSGRIVPDHLSILDVHTLTDTVDLRTEYNVKHLSVNKGFDNLFNEKKIVLVWRQTELVALPPTFLLISVRWL